jgi:hypothetical protein
MTNNDKTKKPSKCQISRMKRIKALPPYKELKRGGISHTRRANLIDQIETQANFRGLAKCLGQTPWRG